MTVVENATENTNALPGMLPIQTLTFDELQAVQIEAIAMDIERSLQIKVEKFSELLMLSGDHNRQNRGVFNNQTRRLHISDVTGSNVTGSVASLALQNAIASRDSVSKDTWRELAVYLLRNVDGLTVSQEKLSPEIGGNVQSIIGVRLSRAAAPVAFEEAFKSEIEALASLPATMQETFLAPLRAKYAEENKVDSRWSLYIVPDVLNEKSRQTWAGIVADSESVSQALSPDA